MSKSSPPSGTETLHLITVRESAEDDLAASTANVDVRFSGQSFFTGEEAFKKAAEVARCVAALEVCGLSEDNIQLLNVSMDVESGLLTKSSAATYHLRVHCPSVALVGSVLAAIAAQKNAAVAAIAWDYADLAKVKQDLLQRAARAAKEVAQSVAEALGVPLAGVHRLSYDVSGLDWGQDVAAVRAFAAPGSTKARRTEALEELNLSHRARVTVAVTAEFMVGMFVTSDIGGDSDGDRTQRAPGDP